MKVDISAHLERLRDISTGTAVSPVHDIKKFFDAHGAAATTGELTLDQTSIWLHDIMDGEVIVRKSKLREAITAYSG